MGSCKSSHEGETRLTAAHALLGLSFDTHLCCLTRWFTVSAIKIKVALLISGSSKIVTMLVCSQRLQTLEAGYSTRLLSRRVTLLLRKSVTQSLTLLPIDHWVLAQSAKRVPNK